MRGPHRLVIEAADLREQDIQDEYNGLWFEPRPWCSCTPGTAADEWPADAEALKGIYAEIGATLYAEEEQTQLLTFTIVFVIVLTVVLTGEPGL